MEFWKMNGAGNDFIVVDDRRNAVPDHPLAGVSRHLCQRHLSIGADGLMVVKPPACGGDYRMLFFNSDGSMGEMCGNGARCICRYGYENGLAGDVQRVETTAGLVTGWRMDQRQYRVRLNDPCHIRLDGRAEVDGRTYDYAYLELGDPGHSPRGGAHGGLAGLRSGGAVPSGSSAPVLQGLSQGRQRQLLRAHRPRPRVRAHL